MILKQTIYGKPSDDFVRTVEEVEQLIDGHLHVKRTIFVRGRIDRTEIRALVVPSGCTERAIA